MSNKTGEASEACRDCGQRPWQAGLNTPAGRLYLCGACADEALANRESKNKRQQQNYEKLLRSVFGKWTAA